MSIIFFALSGKQVGVKLILFHFKGWSQQFDEWIEIDSERIKPHNFFTNPNACTLQEQEAYQGVFATKKVQKNAIKKEITSKKQGPDKKKAKSAIGIYMCIRLFIITMIEFHVIILRFQVLRVEVKLTLRRF